MAITIALANHNGGPGKTTATWYLAKAFAAAGHSPILIDMDPQANLSTRSGVLTNGRTIGDVLGGAAPATCSLRQALKRFDAIDGAQIVPSMVTLANVEVGLSQRQFGRLTALQSALKDAHLSSIGDDNEKVGPILIDCPPMLGALTLNALVAADYVIVPTTPMPDSIAGVKMIRQVQGQISQEMNTYLPIIMGTIVTCYEKALKSHEEGLAELNNRERYPMILGITPKRGGVDADQKLSIAYADIIPVIAKRMEESC